MITPDIKKQQAEIELALSEKRIKDALSLLSELTKTHHGGKLIDDHYNLEFTYKSMLKYTVEGVSDPERQKVYNGILTSCYQLSDQLFSTIQNHQSSEIFYETRRQVNNSLKTVTTTGELFYAEIAQNKLFDQANANHTHTHQATTELFNQIWVSEGLNDEDNAFIKKFILDDSIHFSFRSLIISALTIGAIKEFCLSKILLLFDFISHAENEISQRAITGLLLVLFKYDNRLKIYPEVTSRIKLIQDNSKLIRNILNITVQLIRTRETEKISNKLNDEIIPEVAKMQPNLRNKLDLDEITGEKSLEDENPDWEDFFKDSPELMSKLEELTELQMEGADVFLTTFKMLKHFSFFNTLHNWLMPFYLENDEIKSVLKDETHLFSSKSIQESLAKSGFLCNSDKYSLFLSVPHMPQFQKDMMGNMFEQQLEQMGELEKDEEMLNSEKQNSIISNRYIQDLYRFYKLHPQHIQFEDIFAWRMDFYNKWFFKDIITDYSQLRQIGEFFFKKEYYQEAAEAFLMIESEEPNQVEIIQKIGYCFQQTKAYSKALNQYLKADILKPDQAWTTKKIALMYKLLKQTDKALEYYHIAERIQPENLHTQASIGNCLLDLKEYSEALKFFFKVEYLDQSNTNVWRPIAWCSLVTGNFDQAEKYYHKLLISSTNTHDFINLGHVYWCKNNRKEALKFYQKATKQLKNTYSEFFDTFTEDLPLLIKNGIDQDDVPIMLDQLKYLLEE
ncbi:tetratricopeptide repeat protein [Labilibacter sediminis]|nr:tetratricopeptide repeat protein [Labilibacter sediminis]